MEKAVTEHMSQALKYCDTETVSARQLVYQSRAVMIHHRLASQFLRTVLERAGLVEAHLPAVKKGDGARYKLLLQVLDIVLETGVVESKLVEKENEDVEEMHGFQLELHRLNTGRQVREEEGKKMVRDAIRCQ